MLFVLLLLSFADGISPGVNRGPRLSKIAVVGGGAAGVVAATVAAEEARRLGRNDESVVLVNLFTSSSAVMPHFRRIEKERKHLNSPILPDPTLPKRKLIEAFPSGGRELAGIFSKRCTPTMLKEWLGGRGVLVTETCVALDGPMGKEKPLVRSGDTSLVDAVESAAVDAGVLIFSGVNVTGISEERNASSSTEDCNRFVISFDGGSRKDFFDCLILAGEEHDFPNQCSNNVEASERCSTTSFDQLDLLIQNESLSRKERADLEKKQKREKKKQEKRAKMGGLDRSEINDVPKLIPEAEEAVTFGEDDIDVKLGEKSVKDTFHGNMDLQPVFDIASTFGHSVSDPVPGLFSFSVTYNGEKEGMPDCCSGDRELVPEARLALKLEVPQETIKKGKGRMRSLPKQLGPLVLEKDKVTGSAALRLSASVARQLHKAQLKGELHMHLAADIGSVESIEEKLVDPSSHDINELVSASCPLVHREIDYDNYDFDTGQFHQMEMPLVPINLWRNLCHHVSIPSEARWCNIPPKKIRALAHLMVDFPLTITGIQPSDTEFSVSGGVDLKEIDMTSMESRRCQKVFFCGSIIDVNGFNGGFNSLASLSTGYVAGCNAAARVCQHIKGK